MNTSDSPSLCCWTLVCCYTHMLPCLSPQESLSAAHSLYHHAKILSPPAARSLHLCEEIPSGQTAASPPNACLICCFCYFQTFTLSQLLFWKQLVYWNVLSFSTTRTFWWSVPLTWRHWHSSRSDVRSFPGCILLGVAASHYSIFLMDMREPQRAEKWL
jgi:hypothetical protein